MLSIEQIAFAMPSISKAADSAKNTGTELFPNNGNDAAQLIHDDNLVDNGDGTFTFTSKISAKYSYSDTSENRLKSTDDYYTFKKPGKYLIELWGADGGDGGRALLSGRNGLGGTGGFVYGVLDVAANEVENAANEKKLFYEIGSKGESKTYDMTSGGSGGDGGGAGEIALVSVGAGGGYSAVYLIDGDAAPFGDKNTFNNSERDDKRKVLMIAGGGGGGAAGANGFHLTALILKMHGDGGDGGTYRSVISATPNIEGFTSGTYYAGENGTSSGGKTSYVGQGGTDRPEGLAKTTIGFMTASTYANDWQMTYHPDLHRGVGGAGNLHGGGGGAGFAGGGGGIQNVILDANNVGGGGGGSSYIADNATISSFYPLNTGYADIDKKTRYFVEEGVERPAGGGAIVITYLDDDDTYYDYLKDVEISGEVSQYFDIVEADSNCKNYKYASATTDNLSVTTTEPTIDYDDNKITISGSLEPIRSGLTKGQAHDTLTLTLKLKPKTDFMGGNDVPIFKEVDGTAGKFHCKSLVATHLNKDCDYTYSSTYNTSDDLKTYKVSHVNVPFMYQVPTTEITRTAGTSYENDLIDNTVKTDNETKYAMAINSRFAVNAPVTSITETVFPTAKGVYRYTVNVVVNPTSDGDNAVGKKKNAHPTTTLTGKSIANVLGADEIFVDGFNIKAKKNLAYNGSTETYDFDVDLTANLINDETFVAYPPIEQQSWTYSSSQSNIPLPAGVYFIEAWGGDGGKGGDNGTVLGLNDNNNAEGGIGGKGGFVSGYYENTSDSTLSVTIGQKGPDGNSANEQVDWLGNPQVTGGEGGRETKVVINNSTLIRAGGGGGGSTPYTLNSGSRFYPGVYGENGGDNPTNNTTVGENGLTTGNTKYDDHLSPAKSSKNEKSSSIVGSINNTELIDVELNTITIPRSNATRTWTSSQIGLITTWSMTTGSIDRSVTYNTTLSSSFFDTSTNNIINGKGYVKITKLGVKGYVDDVECTTTIEYNTKLNEKKNELKTKLENALISGFIIGESFSQYFVVDSENAPVPLTGDQNTTVVTTSVPNQDYGFVLGLTSGDAAAQVSTATSPTETNPVAIYPAVTKTTYTYSLLETKVGVRVHLKRKPNLIGGNDIPLLNVSKISEIADMSTYMRATTDTEVSIYHTGTTPNTPTDDDTGYVPRNDATDWANVPLNGAAFEVSTSAPVIADYGETATATGQADYTAYSGGGVWIDDFVQLDSTVSPTEFTQDGTCTVKGVLSSPEAQKAVVQAPVEDIVKTGSVDVKMRYKVSKYLNNITDSGAKCLNGTNIVSFVPSETGSGEGFTYDKFTLDQINNAYVLELTAAANYDLPDVSGVYVTYADGGTVIAAEVKKADGKITVAIPASAFTDNIVITAAGNSNRKPHYVHFLYQIYDPTGGPKNGFQTKESTLMEGDAKKAFYSGDELDTYVTGHLPYDYTSVIMPEGYEGYVWEWSVEKNEADKHIMGDKDVYIMGSYKPITYTLIINYVAADQNDTTFAGLIGDKTPYRSPEKSNYNEADGSYDIALTNGAEYMVKSPEVEGYVPSKLYYSGKVNEAFFSDSKYNSGTKTFTDTVTYSPKETLTIYRIICDDYGIPVEELLPRGTTPGSDYFNFKTTKWDVDTQTGKEGEVEVDFIGGSGTYYVYYKPHHNEYTVIFHKVDQNSQVKPDEQNIKLAYDNCKVYEDLEFGYDFEKETYVGFPNIICANYLFDGWYTENGKPIYGDTIVRREYADASNEIHLYARWKSNQVQIRIDYKYGLNEEGLAGQPVGDSVDRPWTYGKYYSFNSPDAPTGYKLFNNEQDVIDGVAWDDVNEIVYYISQSGTTQSTTLTINVYSKSAEDETNPGNPKANAYTLEGGTIKLKNSNGDVIASVANKGTVTLNNIQYPFAAGNYTIEVEPPEGYEADTKPITLVSGENASVNIFLDREPLMLPMAGSKPMTGYTVFGISSMLLAGLLMFAYVNSRTEENNEKE